MKEVEDATQGSQLYHPVEYTETKRFEHEAFLAEVVGKPAGGKHIAIIGEPGAGKTTILTKIGAWLIEQAEQQPPAPLVVAWISLADVGDRRLQEYLRAEWLQKVCEDNFDAAWEDWKRLRQQGQVWLLLDGLDEMSGDALAAIHRDLGQAWAQNLRVVMTCRLNQWETAAGGNILTNSFDVYRTLDYDYQTSQGEDQVKEFISKWFADNQKVATQIRTELDAPGKERIKDLVKNPLRLTLLCASWEKDNQALPETKANLYRGFVNYLYRWKAVEFSGEVKLKQELNLALGQLAKAGLNRQPINDGAVRRFRFTASEISELWADLSNTLLPTAKNLGWLNVVGEETGEDVYAFYHPTFQEYFAACSIDDWDYFLPRAHIDRPVPCQGEDVPTYRVFERQWQQVILFWIGIINNAQNDERESFIETLINFNKQEEEFYYYRAYCLAGIFIGEFKQFQRSEEITQQIVTWAFGCIDSESMKRNFFLKSIQSLALETLPLVHREYTILSLIDLMKKPDLPDTHYEDLTNIIGQIGMGDTNVISSLVSLLKQPNISKRHHFYVVSLLEKVGRGNEQLITDLLRIFTDYITSSLKVIKDTDIIDELLRNWKLDDFLHSLNLNIANTLGKIGVGNKDTIASLEKLLSYPGLLDRQLSHVAFALGAIDKGNDRAIFCLVELLEHKRYSNYHHHDIAELLGIIGMDDERVIRALLKPLEQNTCYPSLYYSIEKSLIKIAVNHGETINSLIELIQQRDSDDSHRYTVANILGEIGISNEKAILALVKLLKYDDLHDSHYSSVANILGKISVDNEYAIFNLSQLLTQSDLSDLRRNYVADVLGEIGSSNQQTISALSQVLNWSDLVCWLRHNISVILGTIDTGDEVYQSNSRQYQAGFDLIFYCAQTLSYPTFQLSWNEPSSLIQKIVKHCIPKQIQLWLITAANNRR